MDPTAALKQEGSITTMLERNDVNVFSHVTCLVRLNSSAQETRNEIPRNFPKNYLPRSFRLTIRLKTRITIKEEEQGHNQLFLLPFQWVAPECQNWLGYDYRMAHRSQLVYYVNCTKTIGQQIEEHIRKYYITMKTKRVIFSFCSTLNFNRNAITVKTHINSR